MSVKDNMKHYGALIFNPAFHKDWTDFIHSPQVRRLSNLPTIRLENIDYQILVARWVKKTAKKYCPPDGDINEVKRVIEGYYCTDYL